MLGSANQELSDDFGFFRQADAAETRDQKQLIPE